MYGVKIFLCGTGNYSYLQRRNGERRGVHDRGREGKKGRGEGEVRREEGGGEEK